MTLPVLASLPPCVPSFTNSTPIVFALVDDAARITSCNGSELVAITKTRLPEVTPVAPVHATTFGFPVVLSGISVVAILHVPNTTLAIVVPLPTTKFVVLAVPLNVAVAVTDSVLDA